MRARLQRIVRRGERQLLDDHQPQRLPLHVHAFPETRGAQQHRIAGVAKNAQQLFARRLALHQQMDMAPSTRSPALAQSSRAAAAARDGW